MNTLNETLVGTSNLLTQIHAQTEPVEKANPVWEGWGSVIFVLAIVAIVALVASVLIWQIFRTAQTRMQTEASVNQAESYRNLAEEAATAQARTTEELAALRAGVDDLRGRVASIERLLAEVG